MRATNWICWRSWPTVLIVNLWIVCFQVRAADLFETGTIPLDRGGIPMDTSIDWDVPPESCQSKTYEWANGAFKCIGRVVQDSGLPLLEPGLRGAVMEAQRDFHLSAQKMYRLKAAVYLTPQWLNFRNAEELMKRGSEAMEKLQDMARLICGTGNTEYSGPMVACVKRETAGGLISKALTGGTARPIHLDKEQLRAASKALTRREKK